MNDQRPMTDPEPDAEPLVRAWIRQPVALPESDLARIAWLVHHTPQQRRWPLPSFPRSFTPMFTAFKLTAAGAVLASLGLFLWSATPTQGPDVPVASPSASPVASVVPSVPLGPVVLQLVEPGSATQVGDWVQLGAAPSAVDGGSWSELSDLQVVGDLLVAHTTFNHADETADEHVLVSADGLAWSEATIPATDPRFTDLLAGPDGLVLSGSDAADGARVARLWGSADGVTWTELPAPPTKSVDQLVSLDGPRVVVVGERLWINRDGATWEQGTRITGFRILQGPGGFQLWGDGGSAGTFFMQHGNADLTEIVEVGGPGKVGDPTDVNLGVVGDHWVLVPAEGGNPDTIYTSVDGIEWVAAPRPAGLTGQELRWITAIGDQAVAFAPVLDADGVGGVFTWTLGEAADAPALFDRADEWIAEPVAWGDGFVAAGMFRGRGSELSLWAYPPAS